jgi:hypothetical protein
MSIIKQTYQYILFELFRCYTVWNSCILYYGALLTLQSQEILNRPVFVLDILKSVWKFWKLLKILNRFWKDYEHYWKFWTDSEHCWKFWTDSEQILKILKIAENFEQILNIPENSEQISIQNLFRIFSNFQNFQTLFRISSIQTGLFRISWLCSV